MANIYMKVPGVSGSVTASGYEKQIQIASMNFGVVRSVSMEVGNIANRQASLPQFTEISLTKQADVSSGGLLNQAVLGVKGLKIEIAVVETGDKPREYVKYELEDAMVSSYNMSATDGSGDQPYEAITLSFAKVTVSFTEYDKANNPGKTDRVVYDLVKGVKG